MLTLWFLPFTCPAFPALQGSIDMKFSNYASALAFFDSHKEAIECAFLRFPDGSKAELK